MITCLNITDIDIYGDFTIDDMVLLNSIVIVISFHS